MLILEGHSLLFHFFFQNRVQSIIYRETIVDVFLYNTISIVEIKVVP